jgi:hypothetical protein
MSGYKGIESSADAKALGPNAGRAEYEQSLKGVQVHYESRSHP